VYNSNKAIPGINNKHTHLLVADVQVSVICFTQVGIPSIQVHDIFVGLVFVPYELFLFKFPFFTLITSLSENLLIYSLTSAYQSFFITIE